MKKIRRTADYEIALEIKNDGFIGTHRDTQRDWLVQRSIEELDRDLKALHDLARHVIPGADHLPLSGTLAQGDAVYEGGKLKIGGQTVMEGWQPKLMSRLAEAAAEGGGDILEIGFGLGLSATKIQSLGVRSHTIVECNASVCQRFEQWRRDYPDRDIRLLYGTWQERADDFGLYDGIVFDTHPITQEEFVQSILEDVTYAQQFFDTAAAHLRPGGIFTYFTGEIDSLSRAHQRLLLQRFSEVRVGLARDLQPQPDSSIWWFPTMAVVKAVK